MRTAPKLIPSVQFHTIRRLQAYTANLHTTFDQGGYSIHSHANCSRRIPAELCPAAPSPTEGVEVALAFFRPDNSGLRSTASGFGRGDPKPAYGSHRKIWTFACPIILRWQSASNHRTPANITHTGETYSKYIQKKRLPLSKEAGVLNSESRFY